ncbi:MAG: hypothetical protein JWO23_2098 [Solirubrobacterales bacterium]|nr:hypothetical protein [Solirubrobacterales bacterium]
MSEPIDARPGEGQTAADAMPGEAEEVDAFPVLAEGETVITARRLDGVLEDRRSSALMMPAVQAAAVAAGGFVAGAAVVGHVHRRRRRSAALPKGRRQGADLGRGGRRGRGGGKAAELVQIVGSRSLLVDVHLLGGPGADG